MGKLNVLVAAGSTSEKIDDVRVMTNISSGKLGAMIADKFIEAGHEVNYVATKGAVMPSSGHYGSFGYRPVKDVASVMEVMAELVPKSDIVCMPLAVSDFTFDYEGAIKCGSNSKDAFIEHMRNTIVATPKVIANFRKWNEKAVLVGFKFTSGKSSGELHAIAMSLKVNNRLDMVLANDKMAMQRAGAHRGVLIMDEWEDKCNSKEEIAESIFTNAIRKASSKNKRA